jgi:hypothetical protein
MDPRSLDVGTSLRCEVSSRPGRSTPKKELRYPLYKILGRPGLDDIENKEFLGLP